MSNTQHRTPTRMRLLVSLITAVALVLTSAFPAGFAYGDEVVVEEGNPNEAVVVAQTPDQKNEVEVQAGQTDATEQDGVGDEAKGQSIGTQEVSTSSTDAEINSIIQSMTPDEKISQMIIPAIRTWGNENVQNLSKYSALAEALRAHQYGGVILFSQNISTVEQTGTLVNALQANNQQAAGDTNIPYLMCVDGEGGVVVRFTMGTRMTGSMAIGATGANAQANAFTTGKVLGEEIASLGFTADLAPTIDVNSNPSNPAIGTRSFSDDPAVVGPLGVEFSKGLAASKVIATYKHFPGNGDVATDSHLGLSISEKSEAELEACELVPFRTAIQSGADMIMTAHIMLPTYERESGVPENEFHDGNKGYYPATMSYQILNNLLRRKLGFDGVVMTDALEMDALYEHQLVASSTTASAGETNEQKKARLKADTTYCANLAEKCILAGVDILLMPTDLNSSTAATFYNDYINAIAAKANASTDLMDRINQSVARILTLKSKYGILETYTPVDINNAKAIVGSDEHHEAEMKIAREAITLVKNDNYALPLSGHENNVVIMGRLKDDNMTIDYAIKELQSKGLIAQDARINNLVDPNRSSGSDSSKMHITIDYYYDSKNSAAHYTNALKDAIKNADTVICFTASYDAGPLAGTSPLYQCVSRALSATHAAGGKFVLLANNLPYDAARYQGADAAMLGYMSAGLGADPTDKSTGGVAYNANVVAAISALFDDVNPGGPTGTLPVNIPDLVEKDNLTIEYTSDILHKRGFGLSYAYAFIEGAGGVHARYSGAGLAFKTNARYDKLRRVLVDDQELGQGDYAAAVGSTKINLASDYLDTLASGDHTLTAVYDYGGGEFNVSTTFSVNKDPVVSYASHVQRIGWQKAVTNGSISGTTGKSRRVEALRISVSDLPCEGGISYRSHVQTKGWEKSWVSDGKTSGTTGKSKRVEAVQLKLTGEAANQYDVYYRVHAQRIGWMAWAKNGESAGTTGMSRRVEAIQVVLVKKGQPAPSNDYQGAKQAYNKAFRKK